MHEQTELDAIDVQRIPAEILSGQKLRAGVHPDELPRCSVKEPESLVEQAAVLSWRWDRSIETARSVNLALAVKHAQESGVRFLFVDAITVDQTLPKDQLLSKVLALQSLFKTIPVIVAYDEQAVPPGELEYTLRRPWILSELRAACQNPTRVTYIGYRYGSTEKRSLLFANELSVIRSTGYANCVLDILHGAVHMTDEADFALILAEFSEILSACNRTFSRGDYLLATFLLTAIHEKSQVVEDGQKTHNHGFRTNYASIQFEKMGLRKFTLAPYRGYLRSFESAQTLRLKGTPVAIWRSKMTASFDRNWIEVLPVAAERIMTVARVPRALRTAYASRADNRTEFLRIPNTAPTPKVSERGIDLVEGKWLERLPDPPARTIGFNPDLWR